MSLNANIELLSVPAAAGSKVYGNRGIMVPELLLSLGTGSPAVGANQVHGGLNLGAAVSTSARKARAIAIQDGADTSQSEIGQDALLSFLNIDAAGARPIEGDVTVINPNDHTINWATVAATRFFSRLLVNGLLGVAVDAFNYPVSNGAFTAISGLSFTPNAYILFWANSPGVTGFKNFGIGFCDGTRQACCAIIDRDNQGTSDSARTQRTDMVFRVCSTSAERMRFEHSAFLSDGVELSATITTATTGTAVIIALKVPQVYVGSFNAPASPGDVNLPHTFDAGVHLFASFCNAAASGLVADACMGLGFTGGAISSVNEEHHSFAWAGSRDNQGFSDAEQIQNLYNCLFLENWIPGFLSLRHAARLTGNRKLTFDIASETAEVIYMALGGVVGKIMRGSGYQGGNY